MASLTHVLFDFFGTLVAYSPSRVEQGYRRSYDLVVSQGARLDYEQFLGLWDSTFEVFELEAQRSLNEYSMDVLCLDFLQKLLGRTPNPSALSEFRDTYLSEWNSAVRYIPGVSALLANLSSAYTLVLVTNTHHAPLVQGHLAAMSISRYFATVLTSVEHGRRKPSPCIFARALEQSGGLAESSLYVGDSLAADYVGSTRAGLRGLLIDPEGRQEVPPQDRISGILELRSRLL